MKKSKITLVILILLTVVSAIISNSSLVYATTIILILAVLKFIGVSFFFMDLKDAHPFWKGSVLVFLIIFTAIILLLI